MLRSASDGRAAPSKLERETSAAGSFFKVHSSPHRQGTGGFFAKPETNWKFFCEQPHCFRFSAIIISCMVYHVSFPG
jgi:hypothetical protein